jgi:hypothetical protein
MKITDIYLDENDKWTLIIEGINEKGRTIKTMTAIPPTDGNRTDIITNFPIGEGYQYNCKDLIIIRVIDGQPNLELID